MVLLSSITQEMAMSFALRRSVASSSLLLRPLLLLRLNSTATSTHSPSLPPNAVTTALIPQVFATRLLPTGSAPAITAHSYDGPARRHVLNSSLVLRQILQRFFGPLEVLPSRPTIDISASLVQITIFYHPLNPAASLNANTVNNLGDLLSGVFKKPVQLRLVKQKYPFSDAFIFAQYISRRLENSSARAVMLQTLPRVRAVKHGRDTPLATWMAGVEVRIAGKPGNGREMEQVTRLGSFTPTRGSIIDRAKHTAVNDKGTYTVAVMMVHKISEGRVKAENGS